MREVTFWVSGSLGLWVVKPTARTCGEVPSPASLGSAAPASPSCLTRLRRPLLAERGEVGVVRRLPSNTARVTFRECSRQHLAPRMRGEVDGTVLGSGG